MTLAELCRAASFEQGTSFQGSKLIAGGCRGSLSQHEGRGTATKEEGRGEGTAMRSPCNPLFRSQLFGSSQLFPISAVVHGGSQPIPNKQNSFSWYMSLRRRIGTLIGFSLVIKLRGAGSQGQDCITGVLRQGSSSKWAPCTLHRACRHSKTVSFLERVGGWLRLPNIEPTKGGALFDEHGLLATSPPPTSCKCRLVAATTKTFPSLLCTAG